AANWLPLPSACAPAVVARFPARLVVRASVCATFPNTANRVRVSTPRPVVFPTPCRWQAQTRCALLALTNRGIVASSIECRLCPRSFECSRRKDTRYQRERHRYPTRSLSPLRNRITSRPFSISLAVRRLRQSALHLQRKGLRGHPIP